MIWTRFLVPFESTLHSDDVYYSALLYCMQAIKAGITGFAESGGRFMERTIQAAVETGMRAAVARSMMDSGREITPQMLETKEEALDRNDALYEAYLDICELEVLEPRYTDDFVLKLLYELINKGTSLRVKLPEGVFDMTTEVHGVYGE